MAEIVKKDKIMQRIIGTVFKMCNFSSLKYGSCIVCWEQCCTKTRCGHQLCENCAESLDKKICPYCRRDLIPWYLDLFIIFAEIHHG